MIDILVDYILRWVFVTNFKLNHTKYTWKIILPQLCYLFLNGIDFLNFKFTFDIYVATLLSILSIHFQSQLLLAIHSTFTFTENRHVPFVFSTECLHMVLELAKNYNKMYLFENNFKVFKINNCLEDKNFESNNKTVRFVFI